MVKYIVKVTQGYTRPEQVITWENCYGESVGTPTIMPAQNYHAGIGFVYRKKTAALKAIADIIGLGGMAVLEC